MTARYRRGRKVHHRRPNHLAQVDMRLGGQGHTIIYPRVACAVARWIGQQRTVRNHRED